MFGTDIIVLMLLVRVILPAALLLWIGDHVQRREVKYRFG